MKGTVKWFNNDKGFGFLSCPELGEDVFVHFSIIEGSGRKTLEDGQEVEFEYEEGDKGLKATACRAVV